MRTFIAIWLCIDATAVVVLLLAGVCNMARIARAMEKIQERNG